MSHTLKLRKMIVEGRIICETSIFVIVNFIDTINEKTGRSFYLQKTYDEVLGDLLW